ncbi:MULTISPECIES: hypothetical protein [unclassified Prochlorococcus]|uniref:hypothetical protein n=1 Tax=unclassified Prochlorococcus TaxID=2627481 RepID=UPI0005337E81|nr:MULTISPECIES: hypothetical protein [unclassified Prochlorococcus]KGG15170.1 Zn-ribbon protein [Prochlorococcus sp. MIT 0602]KGG17443.1 Zn-ribbon protein [Prochlorococcus sp. MIT 0603]
MSSSVAKNHEQGSPSLSSRTLEVNVCEQCGGNGYMKSTPNCYHTCLNCLGRGLTPQTSK